MTSYSEKGKEVLNRSGLFPDYDAAFWYFLKGAQSGEKDAFFMLAKIENGGRNLTQEEIDKIVAEFYCAG